MDIEKLYEFACDNLRFACINAHGGNVEEGNGMYEIIKKDPPSYAKAYEYAYKELVPALRIYAEVREELLKSKGGTAYSALKRIVKNVGGRAGLAGVWYDSENRQCVCDGYRAVRMVSHIDGFDTVKGIDLDKCYPNVADLDTEIAMPTHGELKANRFKDKSNPKRYLYDFGDGLPMVDAGFLKDVMDCLPNAKAYINGSHCELATIVLKSDNGDAILLPVRKKAA